MDQFNNSVYPILYKGVPFLVTPIGDKPVTTFLIDLEENFILIEKHTDPNGVAFWTEYGKGLTALSNDLGKVIEEKNHDTSAFR